MRNDNNVIYNPQRAECECDYCITMMYSNCSFNLQLLFAFDRATRLVVYLQTKPGKYRLY